MTVKEGKSGGADKDLSEREAAAVDTRQEIAAGLSELLGDRTSEQEPEASDGHESDDSIREGLDEFLNDDGTPSGPEKKMPGEEPPLSSDEEDPFDMSNVTATMTIPDESDGSQEEQIREATITRRKVLAALGISSLVALAFFNAPIIKHIESLDQQSDAELLAAARRNWYEKRGQPEGKAEEEEGGILDWLLGGGVPNQHYPSPKMLSARAMSILEKQGKKSPYQLDGTTKNFIKEILLGQAIEEPLVEEKIHGQDVILKKSVMDRLRTVADELKDEHNIKLLIGRRSHFRDNQDQYNLSMEYDIVGSIAGSYHLLAQGVDIQNAGVETKDAFVIRKVMRKHGFRWGVKIAAGKREFKANRISRFFSNLWHALPGGVSLKKIDAAFRESETEDRVHFDMPLSRLEDTEDEFEELMEKKKTGDELKAQKKKRKKKGKK